MDATGHSTQRHLFWPDYARFWAILGVITIHFSAPVMEYFGQIEAQTWWIGNFYDSISRFCVPMFVMLSGMLLLSKEYPLGVFFRKRTLRILLPFLFWCAVYIIHKLIIKYQLGQLSDLRSTLVWIIYNMKEGPSNHLWFMYMIIGLYLIFPVISKWTHNSSRTELWYYIGIWFLVSIWSLPVIDRFRPAVELRYFTGYLGYAVLGYCLSLYRASSKSKTIGWTLFIAGNIIIFFGTYLASRTIHGFSGIFYDGLSPSVTLTAAGLFLILQDFRLKDGWPKKVITEISKHGFGIYLVHLLVLELMHDFGMDCRMTHPSVAIPLCTLICLSFSYLIVKILSRLPYGSYFAG